MGHIGAVGGPAAFGSKAIRRSTNGAKSTVQDPAIDLSPAIRRSDSFSSNAGWDSGRTGGNRYSKTEARYSGGSGGGGQTVCKREAFYVVEVCCFTCCFKQYA